MSDQPTEKPKAKRTLKKQKVEDEDTKPVVVCRLNVKGKKTDADKNIEIVDSAFKKLKLNNADDFELRYVLSYSF